MQTAIKILQELHRVFNEKKDFDVATLAERLKGSADISDITRFLNEYVAAGLLDKAWEQDNDLFVYLGGETYTTNSCCGNCDCDIK